MKKCSNIKRKRYFKFVLGIIVGIVISATTVYGVTTIGNGNDLVYSNTSSKLTSNTAQDALDEIYSIGHRCPDDYTCFKLKDTLSVGDYVSMTPTKSSYTTDTSKTGYSSTQTINPQELNLWRVISINDDGTVDIVSEHVSSTTVAFQGKNGYKNLVGYLNVLASQYENSTYTKGARHFGYNGQTEYITDTSKFTTTAPWTCSTGGNCNPLETQGGGDKLYTKDYNLVKSVLGTTIAIQPAGTDYSYWIASRYYKYSSATRYDWYGRSVSASGIVSYGGIYGLYSYVSSGFEANSRRNSLRPILTLKSGLKYSGLGTENYPMKISVS